MSIKYRVWNQAKTEYFETIDYQLAYEVRKGSDTNCWSPDEPYEKCQEGVEFIDKWIDDNCTIEEIHS